LSTTQRTHRQRISISLIIELNERDTGTNNPIYVFPPIGQFYMKLENCRSEGAITHKFPINLSEWPKSFFPRH
jgi:hypothetical protein